MPSDAQRDADTCVSARFRSNNKSISSRLVAFDGTKTRLLWSRPGKYTGDYWVFERGGGPTDEQFFKLRDVPASWGELIYIVDAAFDPIPSKTGGFTTTVVTPAEIERLKQAGWIGVSRRLTVRKAGAKIVAPKYPKTPNTQYLGTKLSKDGANWTIRVRLRYIGPKPPFEQLPPLSVSKGPIFKEADGKSALINGASYSSIIVGRDPKTDEDGVTITVPLKSLGKSRSITMQMDIADPYAAPLRIETKLQVPKAPA